MEKVTRDVIAHRLADRIDFLTVAQARLATHAIFEIMEESLKQRAVVEIRGFGSFRVKQYDARMRMDPHTRAKTRVPPRCSVRFRSGAGLRSMPVAEAEIKDSEPSEDLAE